MAANQITVKLTPPDKHRVDFDEFIKFCQAVAQCLRHSEQLITGSEQPHIHYVLTDLEYGSAKVSVAALKPAKGPDERRKVMAFFQRTVKSIQRGDKPDPRLKPTDLESFRALADPVKHGSRAEIGRVRLTAKFIENIEGLAAVSTLSEGFVTGTLCPGSA